MIKNSLIKTNFKFNFPVIFKSYQGDGPDSGWYIEGMAASISANDRNEPCYLFSEESLRNSVQDLLDNGVLFYDHNTSDPIGKIVDAKYIQNKGIWIKARISKTAVKVWELIKEEILTGFSIGGTVLSYIKEFSDELSKVVRRVQEFVALEASVVALPANTDTRIEGYLEKSFNKLNIKNLDGGDIMVIEKKVDDVVEEEKIQKDMEVKKDEVKVDEVKVAETKVDEVKVDEVKVDAKVDEVKVEEKKDEVKVEEKKDEVKVDEVIVKSEDKVCATDEKKDEVKKEDAPVDPEKLDIVSELKDIVKIDDMGKIVIAINALIDKLSKNNYAYYYEKKSVDLDAYISKSKEIESKVEVIEKAIKEFKVPDVDKDAIRGIVKDILKEIPDTSEELRKSLSLIQEKIDELDLKKPETKDASTRLREKLNKHYLNK